MNFREAPTYLLVRVILLYKRYLSPYLPRACRFTPTCSEYARLALSERGFWRGGSATILRLCRCHPLHPGGIDLPEMRTQERG